MQGGLGIVMEDDCVYIMYAIIPKLLTYIVLRL